MEKIFKNDFNQVITEYFANQLTSFTIEYFDQNNLHKIESYSNRILTDIDVFRAGNESDATILSQIGSHIVSTKTVSIVDIETIGNYKIHSKKEYSKGNPTSGLVKQLFDNNNHQIAYAHFDENGNQDFLSTEKYLFNSAGEEILGFEYHENGSINYTWGILVNNTDKRQNGSIYAEDINTYFPNILTENPYYSNATFLP